MARRPVSGLHLIAFCTAPSGYAPLVSADEVEIVPYQDGPYLVRGPVTLRDQDGRSIEPGRRTIALCRCGKSRMRPFCDGTHQLIRFKVPSRPEQERNAELNGRPALGARAIRRPVATNGSVPQQLQDGALRMHDLEGADDCIGRALSLLTAARVLVDGSCATAGAAAIDTDWTAPCVCLVRSAISAIEQAAQSGDRELLKVIEQLSVLVALLERPGGAQ